MASSDVRDSQTGARRRAGHAGTGSPARWCLRTRTIPPALRRALEVRDRACRFPGCGLRFTDGHHVVHWADGGETSLRNCVLLCRHHHRLVHEGGWTVAWWGEGRPVFHDPRGGAHYDGGWKPPQLPDAPVARLLDDNRSRGVRPDGWTAGARWQSERDVPWTVVARFAGPSSPPIDSRWRSARFPSVSRSSPLAEFEALEEALPAFGATVWPTGELEADDAMAITGSFL